MGSSERPREREREKNLLPFVIVVFFVMLSHIVAVNDMLKVNDSHLFFISIMNEAHLRFRFDSH